jgi:hypothetical protein
MPLSKYYGGHGEEVMQKMIKKYGKKKGKKIFYATAHQQANELEKA